MLFKNDRRHTKLAEPSAEGDAALTTADDKDIGLCAISEFAQLGLALFLPRSAVLAGTVLGTERTIETLVFFMAL